MRNGEERRFAGASGDLAALWWPGQGTPVVALHGWLDNAMSFAPLAQHLARPLLALDLPGHGLSAHRPAGLATHYIDHVRDLSLVLDAFGAERVTLLGHSMGAGIACLYAATFPERIERLLLIEGLGPPTTPGAEAPVLLRRAIEGMAALAGKRKPVYATLDEAVAARMGGFGGLDEPNARLLCERGLEPVTGGLTWRSDPRLRLPSSLRLTEEQVEGFLRAVTAPTLLVVGEQGMGGTGMFDHRLPWLADLVVRRLPGRHHLHMESAAQVVATIDAFLDDRADAGREAPRASTPSTDSTEG